MKVIRNKFIPFPGYKAINLFGIIFVREGAKFDEYDYNHELIHLKQMQEMLFIFYYLWYAIEYLVIFCFARWKKQGDRYYDVSFEEEAHRFDNDLRYCSWRKHYRWFSYIKLNSKYQKTRTK